MLCRHCSSKLEHTFLDLGFAPPSNAYLNEADLAKGEYYFPLKLKVCTQCWLVQTEDYNAAEELFRPDYAYFSSISKAWLKHAAEYCEMITKRFKLSATSHVVEVASNDGYLLKNFVEQKIPCLGIEPTASTAEAAERLGIPVVREFFGELLAERLKAEGRLADLIAGNNVFAHVPDINDFTDGLRVLLKPQGVVTLEFPHLKQLIAMNQFDTVYHEHFSYLSLFTVSKIMQRAKLRVFDVDELPTHGGSLRVYIGHQASTHETSPSVEKVLKEEAASGLQSLDTYQAFQPRADQVKNDFLKFLIQANEQGKKVVGYGAAAKGNTLMNYAGVKPDLLSVIADAAPSKQGKWMPGSHIPIVPPDRLAEEKPDYIVILPWNISHEVMTSLKALHQRGARFVTAIPQLTIHE
jgi:hypothetical protein